MQTAAIAERTGLAKRTVRAYLADAPAARAPVEAGPPPDYYTQAAIDARLAAGLSARFEDNAEQQVDAAPARARRAVPPQFAARNRRQSQGRYVRERDPIESAMPGDSVVVADPLRPGQERVLVKTADRDSGPGMIGGLPTSARFSLP